MEPDEYIPVSYIAPRSALRSSQLGFSQCDPVAEGGHSSREIWEGGGGGAYTEARHRGGESVSAMRNERDARERDIMARDIREMEVVSDRQAREREERKRDALGTAVRIGNANPNRDSRVLQHGGFDSLIEDDSSDIRRTAISAAYGEDEQWAVVYGFEPHEWSVVKRFVEDHCGLIAESIRTSFNYNYISFSSNDQMAKCLKLNGVPIPSIGINLRVTSTSSQAIRHGHTQNIPSNQTAMWQSNVSSDNQYFGQGEVQNLSAGWLWNKSRHVRKAMLEVMFASE